MGLNRPGGRIVVRWTPSPKLKGKKIAVLRAHHVRIDLGLLLNGKAQLGLLLAP